MTRLHTDLSRVPVSVAPSPATSGTSLGVTDANAAYLPDTYPYWAVVVPTGAAPTRANAEIVKVTAGSSSGGTTTLTIVRAQGIPVTTAKTVTTSFDIYDANSSEANIGLNHLVINETPSGTVNGSNAAFDTANAYVAGTIQVYRDGQLMKGGGADYTETDSNTITFTTAPATGSVLLVSYQKTFTTSGNADTLDGYHANATPTAGNIPVLDSSALLPAATIPTATDAEITTGTETAKFITPKELADATVGKLGAAWTSWTPTFTNCTVGSGSVSGYYCRIGKFITGYAQFTYGAGSSVGQAELVLPVTISSNYASFTPIGLVTFDDSGTLYNGRIYNTNYISVDTVSSTRIIHNNVSATVPFTFASGDRIKVFFTYEAA